MHAKEMTALIADIKSSVAVKALESDFIGADVLDKLSKLEHMIHYFEERPGALMKCPRGDPDCDYYKP